MPQLRLRWLRASRRWPMQESLTVSRVPRVSVVLLGLRVLPGLKGLRASLVLAVRLGLKVSADQRVIRVQREPRDPKARKEVQGLQVPLDLLAQQVLQALLV